MKVLFAVFTLVFSLTVHAKVLKGKDQNVYKAAVKDGVADGSWSCYPAEDGRRQIYNGVGAATETEVSDDDSQPLISFKNGDDRNSEIITITTSRDFKTLLKVEDKTFAFISVKVGDYKNPRYESRWVETTSETCEKQ